jgi:hypothetical protein
MADHHVDELAELYALGALAESEAAAVERHGAQCTRCARRIGEAEETVLALERECAAQQPPDALGTRLPFERHAASWWRFAAALAAGIVIGIGVTIVQPRPGPQSQQVVTAMIRSHFSHAQFAPLASGAPDAKVIYAHDRGWLYVIATGSEAYEVDAVNGSSRTPLGTLLPDGSVSTLFVDRRITALTLELSDHGRVVERAMLR